MVNGKSEIIFIKEKTKKYILERNIKYMKNYIKRLNIKYNLLNIFQYSILINIVLFVIDYYNLFINNLKYVKEINKFIAIIIIQIIIIICIEVYKNKFHKIFTSKSINFLDKILMILLNIEIISIINIILFFEFWKLIIWFVLVMINFFFLVYRSRKCKLNISKSNNIKELYNNKIKRKNNEILLLEEKPIERKVDDLLDESIFVNNLSKIIESRSIETNVIGLIGDWARGKTSIINMLKENCQNLKISTFDPWKYNDENILFSNFYNHLIKEINCGYNILELNNKFLKYFELIFGILKNKYGITNIITQKDNDADKIKNEIDEILQISEKKVVIVIDDLDRLNKEQILFIFKALKTIINFKNITYILCYDEDRIKKMFKEDFRIDFKYLDKIVNNKVYCPKINYITINKISKICIENLIKYYDINIIEKDRIYKIIYYISKDINDIRELIKFINMLSPSLNVFNDLNLNIVDFIGLEFIKFKYNYEYNLIYINRNYFATESNQEFNDGYNYFLFNEYNDNVREIYNKIFDDNHILLNISEEIFESVKRYKANKNTFKLRNQNSFISTKDDSTLNKRVYNGKYFNIYFNFNSNFFTILNSEIDKFIIAFNKNEEKLKELIERFYNLFDRKDINYVFEMLALRITEIKDSEKLYDESINIIDKINNREIFNLGSRDKLNILCAKLLEVFSDELAKNKIDKLIAYDLLIAEKIYYFFTSKNKYYDENKKEVKANYFKFKLCTIAEEYITKKINIFDKEKYVPKFGWFIYRMSKENKVLFINYINDLVDKENVFRIVYDCTSEFVSDVIKFEFNNDNAENYIDLNLLNNKISEVDYKLNKEQSVLKECYELKEPYEIITKPNDFDINKL